MATNTDRHVDVYRETERDTIGHHPSDADLDSWLSFLTAYCEVEGLTVRLHPGCGEKQLSSDAHEAGDEDVLRAAWDAWCST